MGRDWEERKRWEEWSKKKRKPHSQHVFISRPIVFHTHRNADGTETMLVIEIGLNYRRSLTLVLTFSWYLIS